MKLAELMDYALHPVVAAAVGSAVGLRAIAGATLVQRLLNLGASFAFAVYAGPAVLEHMQISSARISAGIIFATGATGLVVFNAIVEAIKQTDLAAWLRGWLPNRGSNGRGNP